MAAFEKFTCRPVSVLALGSVNQSFGNGYMQWLGSRKSHWQVHVIWHVPPFVPQDEPGGSHCSPGSRLPLLQSPLSVVVDVLVVVEHVPSAVGFETLKSAAPLFVTVPLANLML